MPLLFLDNIEVCHGEVGSSRTLGRFPGRRVRRNKQSSDNCGCSQHLGRGSVEAHQDHTSPREDSNLEQERPCARGC